MSNDPSATGIGAEDGRSSARVVLDQLRRRPRQTIAQMMPATSMSRVAMTRTLAELVDRGVAQLDMRREQTGGRSAAAYSFLQDAAAVGAVKVGRSSVQVGFADLSGRLLWWQAAPLPPDLSTTGRWEAAGRLLDEAVRRRPVRQPLWGIGVAVSESPGTGSGHGKGEDRNGHETVDRLFADRWSRRHRVPVMVDGDLNLTMAAELAQGTARGLADVLLIKLGTEIAAGIVMGGRLIRGASGFAGQMGHLRTDGTRPCACGGLGCAAAEAGGAAIARQAEAAADRSPVLRRRMVDRGVLTAEDVGRAAAVGDPACSSLLRDAGRRTAVVLDGMISLLNPGLVIVSGGLTASGDDFLAPLREVVGSRASLHVRLPAVPGEPWPQNMALTGAACLVAEQVLADLTAVPAERRRRATG